MPRSRKDAWLRDELILALDLYMNEWSRVHADACEARRRGEQSDELVDRRMACLGQRKAALRKCKKKKKRPVIEIQ